MKREILEAVFPYIKDAEYSENITHRGWWAAFIKDGSIFQICVFNRKFWAECTLEGETSILPIPFEAITLIAKYADQQAEL